MYEEISKYIEQACYEEAEACIHTETEKTGYTDILAILEAEICYQKQEYQKMFSCIQRGLIYNCRNYELYFMLGQYYLKHNPKQAYLCFEQAAYYCDDVQDQSVIEDAKEALAIQGYRVPEVSVIIPSYRAKAELSLCLDSLRETIDVTSNEIIVIDNASDDEVTEYLKRQNDIRLYCSDTNLGFPAACNLGIIMAKPDHDILLLHNDTMVSVNAVFWLWMGLYESEEIGAAGSVSNSISNHQQVKQEFEKGSDYMLFAEENNIPMEHPYEDKLRLVGFSMILKRSVLNRIGLLDERFSPAYFEDDDLSYRIIQAGYKLLLCKNSFVYHFSKGSFRKNLRSYFDLVDKNAAKFKEKWGFDCQYYRYERYEIVKLLEETKPNGAFRVLEIGCGMGATLGCIQGLYQEAEVYGIEIAETIMPIAKKYLPTIIHGNIEQITMPYEEGFFDYIICADVLEHLHDPAQILKMLHRYLKKDGRLIASIPNLMHAPVIVELLKGNFTYEESGILDWTHIHFFTWNEIKAMFLDCGYQIEITDHTEHMPKMSEEDQGIYDALLQIPGVAAKREFEVYQYLLVAKKC